jgi:hypothetical protein
MICSGCGSESFGAVFTNGAVRNRCNGCGNLFAPEVTEQPGPTEEQEPRPIPAPVLRAVTAPQQAAPLSTTSLLKSARARARELTREINRLKALTKERDELRRLIAAAKQPSPKRTATVRQLRATGE